MEVVSLEDLFSPDGILALEVSSPNHLDEVLRLAVNLATDWRRNQPPVDQVMVARNPAKCVVHLVLSLKGDNAIRTLAGWTQYFAQFPEWINSATIIPFDLAEAGLTIAQVMELALSSDDDLGPSDYPLQ